MRPLYAEKIHARHTPAITAHTSSCFPRLFRPTTRPASLLRLGRIQSRRSPRSAHERIQFDTHLQHAAPCHNFPGHLSLMYAALADMYVPHDYTHARKRRRSCPRRPRWSRLRRPKRSRQKRGRCACYIITYRRAYTHMHRQCLSRLRRLPDDPVELTEAVFNPPPPLMSICPCSSLHAHVTFVEVPAPPFWANTVYVSLPARRYPSAAIRSHHSFPTSLPTPAPMLPRATTPQKGRCDQTHIHSHTRACARAARGQGARGRVHTRTHARTHTRTHARTHARSPLRSAAYRHPHTPYIPYTPYTP